jgi:hypothetical protein
LYFLYASWEQRAYDTSVLNSCHLFISVCGSSILYNSKWCELCSHKWKSTQNCVNIQCV